MDQLKLAGLIAANIRPPSGWDQSTDPPTPIFTPPLTATEQTALNDLILMQQFGVTLTLAEWQSIKPDAAGLKAYVGLASPTLAQTAAATKAIIRALAVIIRD